MLFSSELLAAQWEAAITSRGLVVNIDQERVSMEGSYIVTWQQWIYEEDQIFQNKKYRKSENLIYSDCAKGTSANVQWTLFDETGAIVHSKKSPVFEFAPPMPGSDRERLHKRICEIGNSKSWAGNATASEKMEKDPSPFEVEKFRSGMSYEAVKNLVVKNSHRTMVIHPNTILSLDASKSDPMPMIALFFCKDKLVKIETSSKVSNFENFIRLTYQKRKELGVPLDIWTKSTKKEVKPFFAEKDSNTINISWRNGTDIVSVNYTKFETNDGLNTVHYSPNECLAPPGSGETLR